MIPYSPAKLSPFMLWGLGYPYSFTPGPLSFAFKTNKHMIQVLAQKQGTYKKDIVSETGHPDSLWEDFYLPQLTNHAQGVTWRPMTPPGPMAFQFTAE